MPPAQWTTTRFSNGCATTGFDGFEGSRQAARLFFDYSVVISAPSQGLTQTVTQTRKKAGGYRRTQWIAHRAESTQKRRKALRSNAFRRASYLHTQEVTGSSPAVSTTYEKSELIPHRERVRIFYFHQRYYRLSVGPRFCLAQNRGLCTFDEAFLLLYNSSINQKGDCIWKFSTFALETTVFQT